MGGRRYRRAPFPPGRAQVRGVSGLFVFSVLPKSRNVQWQEAALRLTGLFGAVENSASMTSSESSQEWKRKGNLLPGRKWRDLKEKRWVGVNSGVVEHTQCEILSLNVQGIMPVKE